jgi:hypothetical protein
MNIALCYDFGNPLKPHKWSTPIGLGKAFEKKGNNVTHYSLDPKNCDFTTLLRESNNYDLIFFCWCGPSQSFDVGLQILKLNTKAKIFIELGDDEPLGYRNVQHRIQYVDAMFTPDLRCHRNYLAMNLPSTWLPVWCDDEIFYYKPEVARTNRCVTSVGDRPFVHELQTKYGELFLNIKVWEYDNTNYLNSGTIGYQYARYNEITRRLFEMGGCKLAILTNRISPETGIYDLFTDDEDIAYFSTEEECLYKMDKLINDDEYRNKLATNMHNKVISKHLIGHRVDEILKVFKEKNNG